MPVRHLVPGGLRHDPHLAPRAHPGAQRRLGMGAGQRPRRRVQIAWRDEEPDLVVHDAVRDTPDTRTPQAIPSRAATPNGSYHGWVGNASAAQ